MNGFSSTRPARRASPLETSDSQCPPFVAIDFETADFAQDSACAVALIRVENLEIVRRAITLIRPPRQHVHFTYIHGITWEQVADKPTFGEAWPQLSLILDGASFLAAHNAGFDRSVLHTCCRVAGLQPPTLPFECSMVLARQTWRIFPTKLPDVCRHLGFTLRHHDPGSDAEACARIVIEAWRTRREKRKP
jgi:DNA polymerase-3 subunit epsilon